MTEDYKLEWHDVGIYLIIFGLLQFILLYFLNFNTDMDNYAISTASDAFLIQILLYKYYDYYTNEKTDVTSLGLVLATLFVIFYIYIDLEGVYKYVLI